MEYTPTNQSQPTSTPDLMSPLPAPPPPPPAPKKRHGLGRIFLAILLILVLLSIGVVVYKSIFKSKTDSPEETQTLVTNEALITVTNDGFDPATITIAKGTQITWTNGATEPHQVAADPYPKNDSIPGFDSTIILQQDESYSFTFEQTGTFTYHDELNPMNIKGSIVVE